MTGDVADDLLARAVANNAAWCGAVCRVHEIPIGFDETRWFALRRTPPFYPDAISLVPGIDPESLVDLINPRPGCSIKDSYADLDGLAELGYVVLFEATWLGRPVNGSTAPPKDDWRVARTADDLAAWQATADPAVRFPERMLRAPGIDLLYSSDCSVVVDSSYGVAGISNLNSTQPDPWPEVIAAVTGRFPDLPLVSYEQDPRSAIAAGFVPLGPLRVWRRERYLRHAVRGDAEQLQQIAGQAYRIYLDRMDRPPAPMLADYARVINDSEVWLIETADGVAAFIELLGRLDHLEVGNLAVRPEFQGRGLGRELMSVAERRTTERGHTELRLHTNEVMTENIELYRHLGFVETGRAEQDGYRRVFLTKVVDGAL